MSRFILKSLLAMSLTADPLLSAGEDESAVIEPDAAQEPAKSDPVLSVKLEVVKQELHPDFCWFHPRVAAVPGAGRRGGPAVIMTIQKHLKVSDYYSGMWMMRTDDLGKTWTGPTGPC